MRSKHSKELEIEKEGRDKGKIFVLTPMSAWDAEEWATKALFAIMNAGVEVPDNIMESGLAGLAYVGFQALKKVRFEEVRPLWEQVMECVQIKPSAKVIRAITKDDIEEVSTLLLLRKEVVKMHLDFFMFGGESISE